VLLHTLPMFHCNGWGMPYAATGMGARHVVLRRVDGEEILKRVSSERVTLMCGAPAVVTAILDAAQARRERSEEVPGRGSVRIVVAGAPPPSRTIERVEGELGWEFIQIYGLTETAPLLTVNRAPAEWDELEPAERARRLARAGTPAIGVKIRIDDEGEVCARANQVFEGYWEQPEESAEVLEDGWFRTGDGGHMDGAHLVISDRKKDVIITGGENVSSIEVEDVLYGHPDVAEAAVIGIPDPRWQERPLACVVPKPGQESSATTESLRSYLEERFPRWWVPEAYELLVELPKTGTGKFDKKVLRERFGNRGNR